MRKPPNSNVAVSGLLVNARHCADGCHPFRRLQQCVPSASVGFSAICSANHYEVFCTLALLSTWLGKEDLSHKLGDSYMTRVDGGGVEFLRSESLQELARKGPRQRNTQQVIIQPTPFGDTRAIIRWPLHDLDAFEKVNALARHAEKNALLRDKVGVPGPADIKPFNLGHLCARPQKRR
jgi:hypothetical protein